MAPSRCARVCRSGRCAALRGRRWLTSLTAEASGASARRVGSASGRLAHPDGSGRRGAETGLLHGRCYGCGGSLWDGAAVAPAAGSPTGESAAATTGVSAGPGIASVIITPTVQEQVGGPYPGTWETTTPDAHFEELTASRCSSACSRDSMGRRRDPRRGETPWRAEQRGHWTTWTWCEPAKTGAGLLITQRSRVQIPPPLLVSTGRSPLPIRKRAFCMTGNVTKWGAGGVRRGLTGETGWHGVRQRGTRETTSPAISGRFPRGSTGTLRS
jgi:hypothetical protein